MSISEIVAKATSNHESGGIVDRDAAIAEALPQVLGDPLAVETIVRQDLARRIKQHLCRVRDDAIQTFNGQGDLFGLRPAHALAGDEGIIKSTRALTRIEFAGLIKMRERQVEDDMSYLARLRFAADETGLIWDRHPNWTWGQVEDAYRRLKKAA
jgi:hypothetical protein